MSIDYRERMRIAGLVLPYHALDTTSLRGSSSSRDYVLMLAVTVQADERGGRVSLRRPVAYEIDHHAILRDSRDGDTAYQERIDTVLRPHMAAAYGATRTPDQDRRLWRLYDSYYLLPGHPGLDRYRHGTEMMSSVLPDLVAYEE